MVLKKENTTFLPFFLREALTTAVIADFDRTSRLFAGRIEEIRLRSGRKSEFCARGTNILGENSVSAAEMQEIFFRLCGGSVYAHTDTLCRGYIRAEGGIRIGVCGRAVTDGTAVKAVHDISSINIRLPCTFMPRVSDLADAFSESGGGMLIFSPPGVGKTTILRSLICDLAGRLGKRTAVIDTRSELSAGLEGEKMRIDVLDGYPRGLGIEIAVRTLNPDVIVCDEIGSMLEASALMTARNCGVPVIASAHGDSARGLVCREGIAELHRSGIFANYVRLSRSRGSDKCIWSFEEIKQIGEKGNV